MKEFRTVAYCPVCEADRDIVAEAEPDAVETRQADWFRRTLRCTVCRAPPRERAIAEVLNDLCPDWREKHIHECSPGGWAVSYKLARECPGYVPTHYDPSFPFGEMHSSGRWRNENLEAQTFADNLFDIVITQDVFGHLFHPDRAAREIARTLKPDGVALMSVPVVRGYRSTQRRARMTEAGIEHLLPAQYHGNPIGDGRSLVTIDWSYDVGAYLTATSGMAWTLMVIDDMARAIRDPYNTVLVGRKATQPIVPD